LTGTTIAPSLAQAWKAMTYCGTLGAMIATRSPFLTPRVTSALAALRAIMFTSP